MISGGGQWIDWKSSWVQHESWLSCGCSTRVCALVCVCGCVCVGVGVGVCGCVCVVLWRWWGYITGFPSDSKDHWWSRAKCGGPEAEHWHLTSILCSAECEVDHEALESPSDSAKEGSGGSDTNSSKFFAHAGRADCSLHPSAEGFCKQGGFRLRLLGGEKGTAATCFSLSVTLGFCGFKMHHKCFSSKSQRVVTS